ncbi:MAG: HAMP domain-containing histidine kinase [Chloroflexi bacterium]|nr:HAMP domain-containing histidine kinase [Chloroflexota bacterium]
MDRLVVDLMDAARIGAGAFQVQPQPTDLVALASQVVQTQQASSPHHCIKLETPDQLEGVWDPDRLAQVLNNLVGNAVKYSPGGGEVQVQLRREDGQAVVSVSDQGSGIRLEDLPLLFQPFSRLYVGLGTRGAGLGLYIAQGIVRAHAGRIWATSPGPGQGATFTFSLPLRR